MQLEGHKAVKIAPNTRGKNHSHPSSYGCLITLQAQPGVRHPDIVCSHGNEESRIDLRKGLQERPVFASEWKYIVALHCRTGSRTVTQRDFPLLIKGQPNCAQQLLACTVSVHSGSASSYCHSGCHTNLCPSPCKGRVFEKSPCKGAGEERWGEGTIGRMLVEFAAQLGEPFLALKGTNHHLKFSHAGTTPMLNKNVLRTSVFFSAPPPSRVKFR